MEHNKEVAMHAKEIAEKRLLKQDYAGAKAMALKAEKLFPLDNISQLLAVCEVQCSAQLMANGLYDWYKIIQVEPFSDEVMIKKQYHKLVALLHPDKNKIPGAEAAFKLLVEANNTLSDQAKRIMYDLKRKHLVRSACPHERTETNADHNSSSNLIRANKWKLQQQIQPQPHQKFTFWTECPGCETRHQYKRNILSHIVCCTHCSKNFIANALPNLNPGHIDGGQSPQQITENNTARNSSSNIDRANEWRPKQQPQPQPHQRFTFWTECPGCENRHQYHRNILSHEVCCTHCFENFIANALPHLNPGHVDGGVGGTTRKITAWVRKLDSNPNPTSMSNLSSPNTVIGRMRGKRFSTDRSQNPSPCSIPNLSFDLNQRIGDREETDGEAHDAGTSTPLRRSPCNKPDFKNNAELGYPSLANMARVKVKGVRDGNSSANAVNTNTIASTSVEGVVKEQERDEEKERVEPNGFLEIINTDFKPSGSAEDMGATSKKARLEINEAPDDNGANATNINTRATTCVEGEIREQDKEKEKGTEQLEPSGFLKEKDTAFKPSASVEGSGATYETARVEVNGVPDGNGNTNATNTNTSASSRAEREVKEQNREKEKEKEQVEPSGLLEKGNTTFKPSGSAEDNCATSKKARLKVMGVQVGNGSADTANTSAGSLVEGKVKEQDRGTARIFTDNAFPHINPGNQPQQFTGQQQPQQSNKPDVKYNGACVSSPAKKPNDDAEKMDVFPDPEFHKFDMCRTRNKFQLGNIWALYSDLDSFPKYYGLISNVKYEPFQVHIKWLKACPKSDVERALLGANLPISCGKFRVTTQNTTYDKPDYFSHMVSVRNHDRGNYYEILPEVGEVWAIYKNWSAGWTPRDFKTSKFDIVEVIENREQSTIVCPLRQVPEYTSVFMSDEVDGTGFGAWKVPASAYILFSHKIPAIRLKEECGGKLEGFWELDPASLPSDILLP